MPKYLVKELSLIGNELVQAGTIIDFDGLPAENLVPQCELGEAKYQEYLDSNVARAKAMKDLYQESALGDTTKFLADFLASQKAAQEEQAVLMASTVAQAVAAAVAALMPPVAKAK